MPEEDALTPERELLKFIEEKSSSKPSSKEVSLQEGTAGAEQQEQPGAHPPTIKTKAVIQRGKSFVSLGGIRGRISYLQASLKNFSWKNLIPDLKVVNTVLLISLVSGLIFVGVNFFLTLHGMKTELDFAFAKLNGQGMNQLILDLRDNGGGTLQAIASL